MSAFEDSLAFVLRPDIEGGISNRPDDPGGLTFQGITQATYDRWRDRNRLVPRPVTKASPDEVATIYRQDYWSSVHLDDLPDKIAIAVFDAGVNVGPNTSVGFLQSALRINVDGINGKGTSAATVAFPDEKMLVWSALAVRWAYYSSRPKKNLNPGWFVRIEKLWAYIYPESQT